MAAMMTGVRPCFARVHVRALVDQQAHQVQIVHGSHQRGGVEGVLRIHIGALFGEKRHRLQASKCRCIHQGVVPRLSLVLTPEPLTSIVLRALILSLRMAR